MKNQISYRNRLFSLLIFFGVLISVTTSAVTYYIMISSSNKENINLMFSEVIGYILLFNLIIIPIHFLIAQVISKAYYRLLSHHKRHEAIMIQQSKMAAIGEMISFIAHQWRQPLNRLASILMRTRTEVKQKKFDIDSFSNNLDEQEHLLEYLSETIESFRNFYKPNNAFSDFSANDAIKQVLELVSPTLKESGIGYSYKKCEDTIVEGRKNEFMQVILTIINNATYILDERKVKNPNIDISTFIKKGSLHITIEDNGGGISVKPIKKIFEAYFTKNNNTKSSGMGLYISKLIIEDHFSGKVKAHNTMSGACFTIIIPIGHLKATSLS